MKTLLLASELTNDPLSRGYLGMTDQQAADDLNTFYRNKTVDSVSGDQIFNATDDSEYAALTDAQQASWDRLCSIAVIDIASGVAKAREAELFGPSTTTRTNLLALKYIPITRAVELDLFDANAENETVTALHVQQARA